MSLDRLINIDVNSSTAQKRLEKLLETLKKLDGEMDSFGSSGSSATGLDKPIKAANQYAGVMSTLSRDIAKTNGAVSAQERALLKYDNAVRNANKNLAQQKYSQQEYNEAISESKKRYEDRIAAINKSETATKSGRKTLLDYSGALENEKRLLQQATGNLSYADAATLRYDTAVRKLNKSAAEGRISQAALSSGLREAESGYQAAYKGATDLDNALAKGRGGFRAMRGAASQLSYQFQDIAVQAQMGTAATTIFTQQFPQIASVFGPAGAVVGVIGAVAGAIAGPLITSMLGAEDTAKKLEKTMQSLDETLEKTESGSYRLSDSFYELGKASKQSQTLQLALAQFKSVDALDDLSKNIRRNTNSISTSFFGMLDDIDIDAYEKAIVKISKASQAELIAAEDWVPSVRYVKTDLKDLSMAMREVEVTQIALGKSFGLTSDQSERLIKNVSSATLEKTNESFDRLDSTLFEIFRTIKDGDDRKAFIEYAEGIQLATEAGRKLNAQAKSLKDGPFGDLQIKVDNTQLANAALNSEFNKTSELLVRIAGEQSRINDLVKSGASNQSTGQFYLDENVIKIISELVGSYDTIEKRQEAINNIKASGIKLSEKELNLINKYAQEQNFVYEKQLNFNDQQIALASLTEGVDKYSSSILKIAKAQDELRNVDYSASGLNDYDIQLTQRQYILKAISDEVASLDTYAKRQELINGLVKAGLDLKQEDLSVISKYAQEQKFVYERQVSFNNSLKENSEIIKEIFNQGAKDYSNSIKSYNTSLQGLVTSTFSSMEDALVNWAVTGKSAFKDFANSVLQDLLRIQIQQSLAGLAGGIGKLFEANPAGILGQSSGATVGGVGSGGVKGFSKGGAFYDSHLTRYAKGGITGMANSIQSTPKRFANGSGLLGEAGQPEGIFPLTRTSGGDLGVKAIGGSSPMSVNVNIKNESGSEMQFEQTGQSTGSDGSLNIDMVAKMVNRVISSGKADRAMTNRFTTRKAVN